MTANFMTFRRMSVKTARNITVSHCTGTGSQKRCDELLAKRRSKSESSADSDHANYDVNTVIEFAAEESARTTPSVNKECSFH